MEESVCLAEINIGALSASAVKNNKRQAKLTAAKNLLRTIDSNAFLKNKFFYYLREQKEPFSQLKKPKSVGEAYQGYPEPKLLVSSDKLAEEFAEPKSPEKTRDEIRPTDDYHDEDEMFEVIESHTEDSVDLKKWLNSLDADLKPIESQQQETNQIFMQVSEVIKVLLPGGYIKVIPLGSYLLGCMRKQNLVVDCILFNSRLTHDSTGTSPSQEVNLKKINELFLERKSMFQLINNHYQLYEVRDR